jgi:hypothetical protein
VHPQTLEPPGRGAAPGYRPLTGGLRWLLRAFAVLALMAGVLLFVLSDDTESWFSWTIEPPLTAAFLGAAYWAAAVLLIWSAGQDRWLSARSAIPPVITIAVLLLVATMKHHDRFHDDLFGWFWTVAYWVVPVLLILLLALQLGVAGSDVRRGRTLPTVARLVLGVQAAVMLAVGGTLYLSSDSAGSLWPWTLTPLTSMAVGAFVFGFGIAAAWAVWERDLLLLRGSALAYLTLGTLELLGALLHRADFGDDAARTAIYIGFLVSVLLTGSWGVLASRATERS